MVYFAIALNNLQLCGVEHAWLRKLWVWQQRKRKWSHWKLHAALPAVVAGLGIRPAAGATMLLPISNSVSYSIRLFLYELPDFARSVQDWLISCTKFLTQLILLRILQPFFSKWPRKHLIFGHIASNGRKNPYFSAVSWFFACLAENMPVSWPNCLSLPENDWFFGRQKGNDNGHNSVHTACCFVKRSHLRFRYAWNAEAASLFKDYLLMNYCCSSTEIGVSRLDLWLETLNLCEQMNVVWSRS